jgi:hypothetical protein
VKNIVSAMAVFLYNWDNKAGQTGFGGMGINIFSEEADYEIS